MIEIRAWWCESIGVPVTRRDVHIDRGCCKPLIEKEAVGKWLRREYSGQLETITGDDIADALERSKEI